MSVKDDLHRPIAPLIIDRPKVRVVITVERTVIDLHPLHVYLGHDRRTMILLGPLGDPRPLRPTEHLEQDLSMFLGNPPHLHPSDRLKI